MMIEKNNVNFLKLCNKFLILINMGLMLYIYFLIFYKIENKPLLSKKRVKVEDLKIDKNEDFLIKNKPFSYYKDEFSRKDIFLGLWQEEKPKKVKKFKVVSKPKEIDNTVEHLKRYYKVMGILLDNDPKVLIKDLRKKETIFLSRGEKIEKAVLKEIFESKIILEYKGELIELVP